MNYNLDLTDSVAIDLTIEKGKTLNKTFQCEIYSGETFTGYFDFTGYTASTLTVKSKPNDFVKAITFSTLDNSIELLPNGQFSLSKTALQTNLRSGKYFYEMVLVSSAETRGFLRGKFFVIDQSYAQVNNDGSTEPIRITVKDDIAISGSTGSGISEAIFNSYTASTETRIEYLESITGDSFTTASNGLTKVNKDFRLGGTITGNTTIEVGTNALVISGSPNYSGADIINLYAAGDGGNLSGFKILDTFGVEVPILYSNNGNDTNEIRLGPDGFVFIQADNTVAQVRLDLGITHGMKFTDGRTVKRGAEYDGNYSSSFGKFSLVDKNYVTGLTTNKFWNISGTTTISGNAIIEAASTFTSTVFRQTGAEVLRLGGSSCRFGYSDGAALLSQLSGKRLVVQDNNATKRGLEYNGNYLTGFTKHSLVDKNFVTGLTSSFVTTNGSQELTNKALGTGTTITAPITINDGVKITFNPNATNAGLNIGTGSNPSSLVNADFWYNTTLHSPMMRVNSVNQYIVSLSNFPSQYAIPYSPSGSGGTFKTSGSFYFTDATGFLVTPSLFLTTVPVLHNSATQIIVRASDTGEVMYRDVSTITGITDTTKSDKLVSIVVVGSGYTVTSNDLDKIIEVTGSTNSTIIVPSGLTEGFIFSVNNVMASNTVTISGGTGTTVQLAGDTLATQYAGCSIYVTNNLIRGFGNLT